MICPREELSGEINKLQLSLRRNCGKGSKETSKGTERWPLSTAHRPHIAGERAGVEAYGLYSASGQLSGPPLQSVLLFAAHRFLRWVNSNGLLPGIRNTGKLCLHYIEISVIML